MCSSDLPVLEKQAVLFEEMLEILWPVGLVAREENLVVGALSPLDAVDMDETEIVDQVVEPITPERPGRRAGQALPFQEDFSRERVGDGNRHGFERLGHVRALFNGRLPYVRTHDNF